MASIRERSGTWQARVIRKGYPAEVKTFATRKAAQEWARMVEASMDQGGYRSRSESDKVAFSDVMQRYAEHVSPTKRGGKDEVIRIAALRRTKMAEHSLQNLSPVVIASFRDNRLKAVGAATVIRDLSLVSSIINHARREWGVSVPNPCLLVKKPTCPRGRSRLLSTSEEERLLAVLAPTARRNGEMLSLVRLALQTAMRRGELLALRWTNIDLNRRTAYLPSTKNGFARTVPLSSAAVEILTAKFGRPRDNVFTLEAAAVAAAFRKAATRAHIEDLHFHDLRHTATTRMAEKLPNVIELAAVTGHRSLQMLKRYYHPQAHELALKLG